MQQLSLPFINPPWHDIPKLMSLTWMTDYALAEAARLGIPIQVIKCTNMSDKDLLVGLPTLAKEHR